MLATSLTRRLLTVAFVLALIVISTTVAIGGGIASEPQAWDPLLIVVTFSSLSDEVDLLLGEACQREYYILAHGEIDPHTYTLSTRDIEALQKADIILSTEHTPFEQRIRELVEKGEVKATYIGVTSLPGIRLLNLPGQDAVNAHFPIYLPQNYKVFLNSLAQALVQHCPNQSQVIQSNLEKALGELEALESRLGKLGDLIAVVATPPTQYALEGLGVEVVHMLAPEPEAGTSPHAMEKAISLLQSGRNVVAGILTVKGEAGEWLPATPVDEWLQGKALETGVPSVFVPHPLEEGSVLSKLEFVYSQLGALDSGGVAIANGQVLKELVIPFLLGLLVVSLLGLWVIAYRAAAPLGGLGPRIWALGLVLVASAVLLLIACRGSEACNLAWIGVMAGSGLALGGLSAVMGVRKLFFLAAAVPHTALVSASLGLLVELVLGGWFKAWALVFNIVLLLLAWRALSQPGSSDRVVALLVGATGSISVIVLYYLTGRLGAGYSVASIVLGDPLLTGAGGATTVLLVGLASLFYVALTFREHVVIGLNRPQAMLAGLRVGLYDTSLVIALAVVGVLILDVVGFILAHILFLLPGSLALTGSRRGLEVPLLAISISVSSSLAGLALAVVTGLSPVGLLGLVLLGQFVLLWGLGR